MWPTGSLLVPTNIYQLEYRQSNGNMNVDSLDLGFVVYNIAPNVNGEYDI